MTSNSTATDGGPPKPKAPNAESRAAMRESRKLMKKRNARRFRTARDIFKALDESAGKR